MAGNYNSIRGREPRDDIRPYMAMSQVSVVCFVGHKYI